MRLPDQCSAAFTLHCLLSVSIYRLDKTDSPLIPGAYIYLLGVQYLISLSDGFVGYTLPLYNTIAIMIKQCYSSPVHADHLQAQPVLYFN